MKTSFESLLEDILPEINFLTVSGAGLRPGHIMESQVVDTIIGYLPDFITEVPSMKNKSFETIEEAYDLKLLNVDGTVEQNAAIKVLDFLGLKYNKEIEYRIKFDITEVTSIKFANNLEKINFEIALTELKKFDKNSKNIFKRLKSHFLVLRVLYANKYKISVEVKKGGKYEADVNVNEIEVGASLAYEKKENALIVSNNRAVPFGVIGYKIKNRNLKEVN